MKNIFLLFSLSFTFFTCTKENANVAPNERSGTETVSDRGHTSCNNQCAIRVDSINWPPTFNTSDTYRVLNQYGNTVWYGNIASELCGFQNIMMGQWYPLYLEELKQYWLEYSYKYPCANIHAGRSVVSIRSAIGQGTTFVLNVGNTPQTNPVLVPFYRFGCGIYKGQLE